MIRQWVRSRRRRILVDVSTQRDYFLPEGAVCIKNRKRVLANVRRIMAWARLKGIPVISICEAYPNNNHGSNISDHCVDGTDGQKKIRYTLLNNSLSFAADGSTDLPRNILRQHRQVIFNSRCLDPFEEPRIDRLLSEVQASEFVLIGVSAEGAVEATVLGLLQRRKKVSVIFDAVGSSDKRAARMAFRKMKAKGAKLIETKKLAGKSRLKRSGFGNDRKLQEKVQPTTAQISAN